VLFRIFPLPWVFFLFSLALLQIRSVVELIFNFAWRKNFVSNNETFIDLKRLIEQRFIEP